MDMELKPRITVVGVGGAGGNAVNNMIRAKLEGVEFVVANTDAQALTQSLVPPDHRIQLGLNVTQGLGAGSKPDVGRSAAEESHEEISTLIKGSNMVFITAGMGGGTGTGAAPVIARAARELGVLTVGVVTKPFHFEGSHRTRTADKGIDELHQYVDTLIIIPNQNLFRVANERTTFADAFKMADDVLYSGVRGVTDLMIMPGLINLDFADIRAVMAEMGKAMMGTGEAQGERRALDAAEAAISNPLLDDVSMKGASGVLINITGGFDMTLYEVDEAANRIRDEVDPDANIIFGSTFDEKLNGTMRVSVVATGIGDVKLNPSFQNAQQSNQTGETEKITPSAFGNSSFSNRDFGFGVSTFTPPKSSAESPVDHGGQIHHQEETAFSTPVSSDKMAPESGSETRGSSTPATDGAMAGDTVVDLNKVQEKGDGHLENQLSQNDLPPSPSVEKQQRPLSAQEEAPTVEKKKTISLFERFTGVARGRVMPTEGDISAKRVPSMISSSDKQGEEDEDILEIPAFLRREN
jgi:cell division protein FtsZ